ncbi:hypothetical protein IMCC3135_00290 [Granulosicoccus antarcticus IMCC3135]|uniref:Uncharacterized protein n=2 Tax=Granulosicoccus TaxID=437504 RepID=A0A2Z2NSN7_9GAMM|nr:hypothetical protein IMCC3135_00290 [Granulosicoccus antarcticus IMCC3135]
MQADSSDASVIAYSREMGLTHADFWRLLPRAMGKQPYTLNGDTVQTTVDTGTLEITLGPPEERRIALLRLPYSVVSFRFVGVDEVQQLAFKAHFDLHFQRGGG